MTLHEASQDQDATATARATSATRVRTSGSPESLRDLRVWRDLPLAGAAIALSLLFAYGFLHLILMIVFARSPSGG